MFFSRVFWFGTLMLCLLSAWTAADARSVHDDPPAFASPAVSAIDLEATHGTGNGSLGFLQTASNDDAAAFDRLTAQTMPVTFDNWFTDVATPMIIANIVAER